MFKLIVKNDLTLIDPPQYIIDKLNNELIIDNPEYIKKEKRGLWLGNTPKKLTLFIKKDENTYILPFGYYEYIFDELKKTHEKVEIETHFSPNKAIILSPLPSLYPYQKEALKILLKAKNGCLEAPCGSGKTRIGLSLIASLGLKALWLTHTKDLLKQSLDSAESLFPSYKDTFGAITEGKVDIGSTITFATVQTLIRLDPKIYQNEFNVVIVDEAHHLAGSPTQATMFYKVINNINARYKFGLSATYKRSDGLIDTIFYNLGKIKHSIKKEDVAKYRVEKIELKQVSIIKDYDISSYTSSDGMLEYNYLIDMLVNDHKRNNTIINNILGNYYKNKIQIVLSLRVAHLKYLASQLAIFNISYLLITSDTKIRNFEAIKNKDIKVLFTTFQLAKEGLDIPSLDTLHITLPIKDEVAIIQSIGRIERKAPNKNKATIIDYLDTNIGYCQSAYKKRLSIYKKLSINY